MFKKAGVGVVVMATALVVMAVGSSSAFAADTVACGFANQTAHFSPAVRLSGGDSGGSGFMFTADAICSVNGEAPANSSFSGGGQYYNQICGTGPVFGSATLDVGAGRHFYASLPFDLEFVGTVGRLVFEVNGDNLGAVQITPTQPATDGETCADVFVMNGGFAGMI